MRLSKTLLLGLALGVGLVSCKKDDEVIPTESDDRLAVRVKIPATIPSQYNLSIGDTVFYELEVDEPTLEDDFETYWIVGEEVDTTMYFDLTVDSVEVWSELDWNGNSADLYVNEYGKKGELFLHDVFGSPSNAIISPIE